MDNTQNISKNEELIDMLFETVYTKEDLLLFYKEVDQLIALVFTGSGNIEEKMDQLISADKKRSLLNFFRALHVNTENPVDVKEALSKIEKAGNTLPVVTLELAFEPTEVIIKTVSYWFLRRLTKKVILDLHLERGIIGGAYIAFDGAYRDYTLQTKINNYFNKSSQQKLRTVNE